MSERVDASGPQGHAGREMIRNDRRRVKTSASRVNGASPTRVYSRALEHDEDPSEGSAEEASFYRH